MPTRPTEKDCNRRGSVTKCKKLARSLRFVLQRFYTVLNPFFGVPYAIKTA